jgi:hypothetical protein
MGGMSYSSWVLPGYDVPVLYRDLRSGYEVKLGSSLSDLTLPENNYTKIIFGDISAANSITGGDEADRLYGGFLPDTLTGGQGKDYLEGGAGNDTLAGGADGDVLHGGDGDEPIFSFGDGLISSRIPTAGRIATTGWRCPAAARYRRASFAATMGCSPTSSTAPPEPPARW